MHQTSEPILHSVRIPATLEVASKPVLINRASQMVCLMRHTYTTTAYAISNIPLDGKLSCSLKHSLCSPKHSLGWQVVIIPLLCSLKHSLGWQVVMQSQTFPCMASRHHTVSVPATPAVASSSGPMKRAAVNIIPRSERMAAAGKRAAPWRAMNV